MSGLQIPPEVRQCCLFLIFFRSYSINFIGMVNYGLLPEPILFNPLKHYLAFIREFVSSRSLSINDPRLKELTRELKHIGTCVMDIYTGNLSQEAIFSEILEFLEINNLKGRKLTGLGQAQDSMTSGL